MDNKIKEKFLLKSNSYALSAKEMNKTCTIIVSVKGYNITTKAGFTDEGALGKLV